MAEKIKTALKSIFCNVNKAEKSGNAWISVPCTVITQKHGRVDILASATFAKTWKAANPALDVPAFDTLVEVIGIELRQGKDAAAALAERERKEKTVAVLMSAAGMSEKQARLTVYGKE